MKNKVCVVTGANSGIGYAVAKGLLFDGAKVIMACRSEARAHEAKARLIKETNSTNLEIIFCDLSLKSSIRDFVTTFSAREEKLDLLCNCAGHVSFERTLTAEGIESNFATNVLGPFYLTKLLLPFFRTDRPTQIINIAGEFHRFFQLDFSDPFYEKKFSALRVGSVSMLERIMLTYDLAQELKDTKIAVNCFHPGNVKTEMTSKMPYILSKLSVLLTPFQATADQGADTCLWLARERESGVDFSGKYFINRREAKSSDASYS